MVFVPPKDAERKLPVESRKSYASLPEILGVPNLIQVQLDSFRWLQEEGLKQLLEEISPIKDFTGNRQEISFIGYEFREPRNSEQECSQRDLTYSAPLYIKTRLLVKGTGEIKEQDLFFGDIPLMTTKGTFITGGAERVVVSQLLRSPGVYFVAEEDPNSGHRLCNAKLVPGHGAWLEFETNNQGVISVKINGKRKIPATTLLRAIGYSNDEELLRLFDKGEDSPELQFVNVTMDREPLVRDTSEALLSIYRKMRPGDPPNIENARRLIENMFFNPVHYDLGSVGRYKLNKRLDIEVPEEQKALTREDIVEIIRRVMMVNIGTDTADDIDHLGNRRVRTVGELIQNQFRIGLVRLERVAKERMSTIPTESATPSALVNIRPVVAAIREFFGSSQLSQFMDQTNPLTELTHKRRLSAMGPGGLSRDRAGFEVRDVHYSHYGRICPIETPEGPNIGLIGSLATYGRINRYGFIETPYRKVISEITEDYDKLEGRIVTEAITDNEDKTIIKSGSTVTRKHIERIKEMAPITVKVVPYVSLEVFYLPADEEDKYIIAQANARLDEKSQFVDERVEVRQSGNYLREIPQNIQYMDVSPKQIFSVAASLIPFLEHDDANRALMGSNMQRQAVPLLSPQAPLVATGMERVAAENSGQVIIARNDGVVASATSSLIQVDTDDGRLDEYQLMKFVRTNQGTCTNQRPLVFKGDRVRKGQVLVDSSSMEKGELALGQNVLCAFMSWEGYNFEDAIIVSSRLVENDIFTSIHIEKHEVEARDTKLGPEEITRDVPNVGEESLRELDENGIIRIGAAVGPDDILVGKITPKGEAELSAEEKLLRAIFGEKAREVKDTSLRVPHGEWGKVINVKVFNGNDLSAGVNQLVQVWVAQKRRNAVGDKLAGRHGNKGVVSIIAPVEEMPFLPDGTPIDIILNPVGVPSRMNIGQVLETHLGWAAKLLGFRALTPVFDGATDTSIEDVLARAWITQEADAVDIDPATNDGTVHLDIAKEWVAERDYDADKVFDDKYPGFAREVCLRLWLEDLGFQSRDLDSDQLEELVVKVSTEKNYPPPIVGKALLRDGHTGQPFDNPITVGYIYMMKLNHLVEDKVHARSTGPYSLISQQPLGGKAQFGGQRFGEMEVWALEAYGAAHNLQEVLTIKSDDVIGRAKAYEAIVKNEDILQPGVPESFKVLVKELQSLGLAIEVINDEEKLSFSNGPRVRGLDDEVTFTDESIQNMIAEAGVSSDILAAEPSEAPVADDTESIMDTSADTDDESEDTDSEDEEDTEDLEMVAESEAEYESENEMDESETGDDD
ncbi:MAG: DNA-directed RNA polymerase subunit beta [Dehalococcoidales bacterium]|nr:DNA-directed RNA polymerase subunit beta [Dehalococcoidales bacterium]